MEQIAIMNIHNGEEIVLMHASEHIPSTGQYKLLAKKRKDGKIEWAHFVQRDNGLKENVYRGEVKDKQELQTVLEIMNRNLTKIFGPAAEMKNAKFDVYQVDDGKIMGGKINTTGEA